MRVYVVIFFGLIYGMQNFPNKITVFLVPALFGAQLIYIGIMNNRLFPSTSAHISLCFSKLVLFGYFKLKPNNFAEVPLDVPTMVVGVSLMMIGVFLHRLQKKGKPRLFFSKFFHSLHDDHDYFLTPEKIKEIELEGECPVCFESYLDKEVDWKEELPELSQNMKEYIERRDSLLMKTPCNHYFHTSCLVSVMNFNMVCPICRQKLPQIS